MKAFKGQGRAMFAVYNTSGVLGPWYPFGNLVSMSVAPDSDKIEVTSTDPDTFGQRLDSLIEGKPATGKISSNRFDHRTLALCWQGSATANTAVAGTVTDESHTATLDGGIRLAHRDVSSVVVKDSAGTTTYDVGDDYTVDALGGFVTPLTGGAITAASTIKISYSYGAQEGYKIAGSTEPSKFIALAFEGKNEFNGKRVSLDIKKCTITPTKDFDVMSKDPASAEFTLDIILVDGETSSYQVYVPEM